MPPISGFDRQVIQRLGEMREQPPEHLQRVPGPKTLVYFLQLYPYLQERGVAVPRSSRTEWRALAPTRLHPAARAAPASALGAARPAGGSAD